tara:strand:- start:53 stop:658 length:606 start_codon:yes stop_codon:yes gene_type:complete
MKKLKDVVITLFTLAVMVSCAAQPVQASNNIKWQLDVGMTQVEHTWDDSHIEGFAPNAIALYEPEMFHVGLIAWHKSNFGVRIAHGFMNKANEVTGGTYKRVSVLFESITSFELMYKYHIFNSTYMYGGIGTYLIPSNHYYEGIDPDSHAANDTDDDEGYFIGINQSLGKSLGIDYRYTHYSQIGDYESTKGVTVSITYKF